ncbi:MAG: hypothetical protein HWQ35_14880 [Nostoc sp. NMS1]|uniref:hypothetical protein n=1 Tax=unclassified Nostoc TaxID=2593658 RepID=UPI0025EECF7C|nr:MULTISPECIES: hypothetical protein [unclassified Nostoc]MBN3907790.1 hypothetical protein [Nostoc sp. NMS1]MBN3991199.1 hypothetical protein [Nostoc sp. NMS2]
MSTTGCAYATSFEIIRAIALSQITARAIATIGYSYAPSDSSVTHHYHKII